jgi:DNA polymerase III delta subunit
VVDAGCVEDAGCEVRDETAFDLADAIGRKDATAALRVFGKISGEEPIKVLGAITRQFRILLKLKTFLRKGDWWVFPINILKDTWPVACVLRKKTSSVLSAS